jgi:hypothetical protein
MSELRYEVLVHEGLRRHREQRLPDGSPEQKSNDSPLTLR